MDLQGGGVGTGIVKGVRINWDVVDSAIETLPGRNVNPDGYIFICILG